MAPPGSAIAIALIPPGEGGTPGGDKTYSALSTDDIEADHETLRARHLLFDTDRHMGNATVPPMFFFRDIDANRFLIVGAADHPAAATARASSGLTPAAGIPTPGWTGGPQASVVRSSR